MSQHSTVLSMQQMVDMKIVCNLAVRTVAMFAFQIYQYDGYKEKTREELARLSQGKVID